MVGGIIDLQGRLFPKLGEKLVIGLERRTEKKTFFPSEATILSFSSSIFPLGIRSIKISLFFASRPVDRVFVTRNDMQ